jgi:hypothetical protein
MVKVNNEKCDSETIAKILKETKKCNGIRASRNGNRDAIAGDQHLSAKDVPLNA